MKTLFTTFLLILSFPFYAGTPGQPTTRNKSTFRIKEFDKIPQPAKKLSEKEAEGLINAFLKSTPPRQEEIAKKLICHGNDSITYILKAMGDEKLTPAEKDTIKNLACNVLLVNSRREILNPPRHDLELDNVDVLQAIDIIKKKYGWKLKYFRESELGIEGIKTTIQLKNASLIDAVSALCKDCKLELDRYIGYIGITDGKGNEKDDGSNLACKVDGVCFFLSFMKIPTNLLREKIKKPPMYLMYLKPACNSDWFALSKTSVQITNLTYPNGKTIRFDSEDNGCFGARLPLRELAFNQGRIAKVKGVMTLDLPIELKLHELVLQETKMPLEHKDGVNFVKILELSKKGKEWFLSYEYGYSGKEGHTGLVEIIDSSLNLLEGDCLSSGTGFGGDEKYESMKYSYPQKPFKLRWIVYSKFEKINIPVEFSDVLVPYKIWEEDWNNLSKYLKMDINDLLKRMIESEDKNERFQIFSSLPLPEEITEKSLKSYIDELKNPQGKNRPYAAFAIGMIAPDLEDFLSEFDQLTTILSNSLNDNDPLVRGGAAWSLNRLGTGGLKVRLTNPNGIKHLLLAENTGLRRLGIEILNNSEFSHPELLDALADSLSSPSPIIKTSALKSLQNLIPQTDKSKISLGVISQLEKVLKDNSAPTRAEGCTVLGALGPFGVPALKSLLPLAEDKDQNVQENALQALVDICAKRNYRKSTKPSGPAGFSGFSDIPQEDEPLAENPQANVNEDYIRSVSNLVAENLTAQSDKIRKEAVISLYRINWISNENILKLKAIALSDPEQETRCAAIDTLADLNQGKTISLDIEDTLLKIAKEKGYESDRAISVMAEQGIAASKVIPIIMEKLANLDASSFDLANDLAKYKKQAVPSLLKGMNLGNANTRYCCISGLIAMARDYRVPLGQPCGDQLIEALQQEKNEKVRNALIQLVSIVKPAPKQTIPILENLLKKGISIDETVKALAAYGKESISSVPLLINALKNTQNEEVIHSLLLSIKSIGISEKEAETLSEMNCEDDSFAGIVILQCLIPYPKQAMQFLKTNKKIQIGDYEGYGRHIISDILAKESPDYSQLHDYILQDKNLPVSVLVQVGKPEFLTRINKLINENKNNPHYVTYLKAAARALGEKPDRIIKISEKDSGGFRPKSAWPGSDKDRWAKSNGHGDGFTSVIITGTLKMPDGKPAKSPNFFNVNDRFLMGEKRKDPAPIKYNPKTGAFVFQSVVFAAYSMGEGQKEPGPYQTGSAIVLIEADGAKPMQVRFFDEMPHVEITLPSRIGQ